MAFLDSLGRVRPGKRKPKKVRIKGYKNPSGKESSNYRHGMHGTRTYRIWQAMLNRCRNPKVANYPWYGGRGIRVCKRWHSFVHFFRDMGECPEGHELDRKRNNRGYSKANCRWVTHAVNMTNTRKTRR